MKFYGLPSKDVCRVAYQMATINNIKCPDSWKKEEMAGKEWLRCFKSRHPDLSMKKPEACSLARATAFNKETVKTFLDNLKAVMDRHLSATVQERYTLVPMYTLVTTCASGQALPPVLVFPRKNYKDYNAEWCSSRIPRTCDSNWMDECGAVCSSYAKFC